jgi:iron(III) transport system permease protein
VALSVLIVAVLPLASLVYQAGVARSEVGATGGPVWSLTHFLTILASTPKEHAAEFGWTLLTGTLAALGAVVLAVLMAWPARRGGSGTVPLIVLTAACLALPGPLIGMGLVKALSQSGIPAVDYLYDKSILAPWAAQTIRSLPLAVLIVWQALRTVPEDTIEMARIDGAGRWTRLARVALPQRYTAVVAAWLVACAIAMGDVAATASDMVIPAGIDLLSRNIAGMLHASVYDRIAGVCLTNAALFVVIGALVVWLMSPKRPKPTS